MTEEEAFRTELGRRIRAARKAADLTLAQVAARAGLSLGFLSQCEKGYNQMAAFKLYNVAAAVGVPVGGLFPDAAVVARECKPMEVEAGPVRLYLLWWDNGEPASWADHEVTLLGVYTSAEKREQAKAEFLAMGKVWPFVRGGEFIDHDGEADTPLNHDPDGPKKAGG